MMNPQKLLRASTSIVLGLALVILLWVAFSSQETATALAQPKLVIPSDMEERQPQSEWIDLLKSQRSQSKNPAQNLTLNVNLTDDSVAGHTPIPASITISVTRAGELLGYQSVLPVLDPPGFFYQVTLDFMDYSISLEPGDLIWLTQAGNSITMTIPALTADISALEDTVFGTAPADEPVTAYLYATEDPGTLYTQTVTTNGTGSYLIEWNSAPDLHPRDHGFISYQPAENQSVYTFFVAALIRGQIGGREISGYVAPYSSVMITITDSSGNFVLNSYAFSSQDGSFSNFGYDWSLGETIEVGDHILIDAQGQTISMTVQPLSIQVDKLNGQITGQTDPNLPIQMLRFAGPLEEDSAEGYYWDNPTEEIYSGTADGGGQFSIPASLESANYGVVAVTGSDEFQTFVRFNIPFLRVFQREPYDEYHAALEGQLNAFSEPITVAIQGPSGYLKDIYPLFTQPNGYFIDFYSYSGGLTFSAGDVITVSSRLGEEISLTLPVFLAEADPDMDTVSGQAPPASVLTIHVLDYGYDAIEGGEGGGWPDELSMVVTATLDGTFIADFGPIGGFSASARGEVTLPLEGQELVETFYADSLCPPRPQYVTVFGNSIGISSAPSCNSAWFTLLDEQGNQKYRQSLSQGQNFYYFNLHDPLTGHPILFLPGDTIKIETGNEDILYPVPDLSAELNQQTRQITGSGPANTELTLNFLSDRYEAYEVYTATTNAQGQFTVNIPVNRSFAAGDRVLISTGVDPVFTRSTGLPLLQAVYHEHYVSGWLPAFTPYTLTWNSVSGMVAQVQDTVGEWEYFSPSWPYTVPYSLTIQPGDQFILQTEAGTTDFTLPTVTGSFNKNTATLTGIAPPDAPLRVSLMADYTLIESTYLTATSTGSFTISFPELLPITSANGRLTYFSEEGHQALVPFATPHWDITLGQKCVSGTAPTPGQPVTITLKAPAGDVEEVVSTIAAEENGSFLVCFQTRPVYANDYLILATSQGTASYHIPDLYARHNYGAKVVEGKLFPNTWVSIQLPSIIFGNVYRNTITDAEGFFGLDTSDIFLPIGNWGEVTVTDSAGNRITIEIPIVGYPQYLPLISQP